MSKATLLELADRVEKAWVVTLMGPMNPKDPFPAYSDPISDEEKTEIAAALRARAQQESR